MGVVFKARQQALNRIVALKLIKSGLFADAEEIRRFHAEAVSAAGLHHQNIVPVYEEGVHAGYHYFSMAFVDGTSLADVLNNGPLSSIQAARLVSTLCDAMSYAHDKGIIHRDLKPSNILVDGDNTPFLTDFGLVKSLSAGSPPTETETGQVLGSPNFMPPEQAAGRTDISPLADVYSLGALLYATLTGKPPFEGHSPAETLKQVIETEPPPPSSIVSSIGRDIETICLKCLDKESSRRYASARELAADLRRFIENRPIAARRPNPAEVLVRWCSRNRLKATLFSLLVLLACVSPIVAYHQAHLYADAQREKSRADDKVLELAKANTELDRSLKAEKAAHALALTNNKRAERNLRHADGAMHNFLLQFGLEGGPLEHFPDAQLLQKKMLVAAKEYYEKLIADNAEADLTPRLASAHFNLAKILERMRGIPRRHLPLIKSRWQFGRGSRNRLRARRMRV